MPRSLLKKWLPSPKKVRETPGLGFLGKLLEDPYLFHLNRRSVSLAFFWGLFVGLLPIPGVQSGVVAVLALYFRFNLPVSLALIWVSNPLTFPILYWAEWKLGTMILGVDSTEYGFSLTYAWFKTIFPRIWAPLLLGSFVTALVVSGLFYFAILWAWRWHVLEKWQQRKLMRQKAKKNKQLR